MLRKLYREDPYVEVHPKDARRFGIEPESLVRVRSRRGAIEAHAVVRATVREGEVFIPMHYPLTNRLTYPAFDPYSRQPSYKHAAVRLEPVTIQAER